MAGALGSSSAIQYLPICFEAALSPVFESGLASDSIRGLTVWANACFLYHGMSIYG